MGTTTVSERPRSRLRKVEEGASHEEWHSDAGTIRVTWNRGGAVKAVIKGHGEGEFAGVATRRFDALLARGGRITIYWDVDSIEKYDSALRVEITDWCMKHRPDITAMYVLSRSKLVLMGVAVANLALRGFATVYSDRPQFDEALRKAGLDGTIPPRGAG